MFVTFATKVLYFNSFRHKVTNLIYEMERGWENRESRFLSNSSFSLNFFILSPYPCRTAAAGCQPDALKKNCVCTNTHVIKKDYFTILFLNLKQFITSGAKDILSIFCKHNAMIVQQHRYSPRAGQEFNDFSSSLKSVMDFLVFCQSVGPWGCKVTLVAFVWLFSTVHLQMKLQIVWPGGCIITLVAFVYLFSGVSFQIFLQIASLVGCKVTLVTFVWLLPTVCFQMSPQMACLWGYKVALAAIVWLFSTVCFQMSFQIACP